MPSKIYILRHGLATHSTTGYGDQILTATLLPEGVPPIKRLAAFLKDIPSDFHVCSEIERCRQTASIVTEMTGKQFSYDSRLNEYHAETFEQLRDRIKDFLDELSTHQYQAVLICSHGSVVSGLKSFLVKGSYLPEDEMDYPHTGELLLIENAKVKKWNFNQEGDVAG